MTRRDHWIRRGLMTHDGELTQRGEREAEYLEECRAGYWDVPVEMDRPSPTGHGWAPDPYPGSSVI